MPKSKHQVKQSIVNKHKLVYLPLLIGMLAILIVSVTSYYISKHILLEQMEQDGINLARLTTRNISKEINSMKMINNLLEGRLTQAGNLAVNHHALAQQYNFQEIVEDLADHENIVYALIVDTNLRSIADSDNEDIGVEYKDDLEYQMTLRGETTGIQWYYDKIDTYVLEVTAPIYERGEVMGILGIGLSMENVYASIYYIFISSVLITILLSLLLLWVQRRNVIRPVDQLAQSIDQIDMKKDAGYRLPVPESDTFLGLFTSINDMLHKNNQYLDQLKKQESYIHYIAYHDDLTNLPNRRMFIEELELELSHNHQGAVMLLDLDNFKEINDTFGHLYGDKVLKRVTEKLLAIKDDHIFISRFGGDEFLILIKNENQLFETENFAKRLIDLFSNRLLIEDSEVMLSFSIGIARYPSNGYNVSELIKKADLAMYAVKHLGKNNYSFFNETMIEIINDEMN